ncbi:MAG: hypothetical protein OXC26_20275 [Albidovulum sp.]|nr:hypothetical protein [Albidovulum sp.]
MTRENEENLERRLFPLGKPTEPISNDSIVFEQYKMFVDTSEWLVARRQTENRFYFSVNALTMSAMGVGISLVDGDESRIGLIAFGIFVLSIVGILLCVAWGRLVNSFVQLNKGKFRVIHEIEKILPIALFEAEWYVLGEGKDPDKYKSSTNVEKVVPQIFMALYVLIAACSLVPGLIWLSRTYF